MILDTLFAALYDPAMARVEKVGLGAWRQALLGALEGEVLEIGAGTGVNLHYYPDGLALTLTEPAAEMRERLLAKREDAEVVDGSAENLPFSDEQFDVVVSCLVLCSVDDVQQCLSEIRRVLKPGGRLVFIEHVGSSSKNMARFQSFIEPVWTVAARGCRLTRQTERELKEAGFAFEELHRDPLPGTPGFASPAIRGVAVKS